MALMKYKKTYQTFFCVFGVCYSTLVDEREAPCTGQLTGVIKRAGYSECQYVLTQTDINDDKNTYCQLDHKTGQVVVYAIKQGQRSYGPLIKLQSDEFKQRTKQEAQIQCEKLCAELLEREIQVGKLSKQDMADLAGALIDARSPKKKNYA